MKQRVADYVADFLISKGVTDVFSVVGGGAMHLNDALGHHKGLKVTYNHHEQACAMAAEAYARIENKPAVVCVTTGPGGTNALTGVCGAFVSSIPMIVISGQVRTETSVFQSGLKLRSKGIQEFDIENVARYMTKYCITIRNPLEIRYHLEKAIFEAIDGRKAPVWLDIPLDVQAANIETDELQGFSAPQEISQPIKQEKIEVLIKEIQKSNRPLIIVGNGVRLANAHTEFLEMIEKLQIPVVVTTAGVDGLWNTHPLYVGITGTTGSRAGNFAVQNADLIFSIGSRLGYSVTGFDFKNWAKSAFKIVCDVDEEELKKESCRANVTVCSDARILINLINHKLQEKLMPKSEWLKKCSEWKIKYPVVLEKHRNDKQANIYFFFEVLSKSLSENNILQVSCGQARIVGSQAISLKQNIRFITNSNFVSMGFDLPAIIGMNRACPDKKIIAVTGEGSIQMNIQELQTIAFHKIPCVIFVLNNKGYHSIRMTQSNFFDNNHIGIGLESGDLSFPDLKRISKAYGFKFTRVKKNKNIAKSIIWALSQNKSCICELMLSEKQETEPKVASRKSENGNIVSARLEDMKPFLPRAELEKNMLSLTPPHHTRRVLRKTNKPISYRTRFLAAA